MKQFTVGKRPLAIDSVVYLGIDAHKQRLHLTLLVGDEVIHRSISNRREELRALLRRLPGCTIQAAYEAGPTGYSLLLWLRAEGCQAFLTPPSTVLKEKSAHIKTDRRDSLALAVQLRAGQLKRVHELEPDAYLDRELTRTREQLIQRRTGICNQIKSKLLFHGVTMPTGVSSWSKAHLHWLENGPSGRAQLDLCLASLVRMFRALTAEAKMLSKEIEALGQTEKYAEKVELLRTVPGIGMLSAMIFLIELGDISRFDTCEEFASYLGLVPGEFSSGETRHQRRITRWGNKRARTVVVESSWTLISKDPRMRQVYDDIKRRRGAGRAIVAIGRRLALTLRAMLRDNVGYQLPA